LISTITIIRKKKKRRKQTFILKKQLQIWHIEIRGEDMKRIILFFGLIGSLAAAPKPTIWLNIYVHGTISPHISLSDFFKVMNQTSKRSIYAEITKIIRTDPFFHQAQPIQELGLRKAFPTKSKKGHGANIFAEFYDDISKIVSQHRNEIRHYTFGWSGLLSLRARHAAAKKLYEQLYQKIIKLKKQGYNLKIRLIGYSHGGTVALYLADEARIYKHPQLSIDELILISTPLQQDNKSYVASPIFKKVFHFYSTGDHVQTSDFLSSITHSFSHHTFLDKGDFKKPKKVTQIQISFLRKKIALPQKDGSIKYIQRRDYINPGHTEMFFFGWAADWYRRHFPIKPLPVALLIPLIIKEIKKQQLEGKDLKATIIPDEEIIIFHVKDDGRNITVPFFTKKQFSILRKKLLKFKPANYKTKHKAKIKEAKAKATKIFKAKLRLRAKKRKALPQIRSTQNKMIKTQSAKVAAKSSTSHPSTTVAHVKITSPVQ